MAEKIEVILVDLGSTIIKSAEVISGEFKNRKRWESIDDLKNQYADLPIIISSVRKNLDDLNETFSDKYHLVLDHTTKLPITLDYKTPETLGPDRIALAVGANHLFQNENNLVVDLGTCMTMDIIDKNGVFKGGIISPGLKTRMRAMSTFTKSLPDISDEWENIPSPILGKSTKESLLSGSFNGMVNEINATIETIKKEFASINIILTGGDTLLAQKLWR
jgi:type III pantothenate kinase